MAFQTEYTLERARAYELEKEKQIGAGGRPAFHLSSRVGWMNDPNGFSYYGGQYHLFYQYHPYDSHWGPMHWGHAVSRDLLHWTYLPAALAPDTEADGDGCFSGSAVELPDGRQLLLYTGVRKERNEDGELTAKQRQCVAIGDGLNYEKYAGNPVLAEADLPEGGTIEDFRDPKVWREADGSYRAAVANYSRLERGTSAVEEGAGARPAGGRDGAGGTGSGASVTGDAAGDAERDSRCTAGFLAAANIRENEEGGQILLYRSADAIHWTYEKKLAVNNYRIGRMWECPDFFELDGRQVLLGSAMDQLPEGFEYHNGNNGFYLIGSWDRGKMVFSEEADHAADYGIDFYAAQTILTPDGRRVMIAWMQNWDTCNLHTRTIPWFGQMTLPRELSVRDGRLCQWPVRELEALRRDRVEYSGVELHDGEIELDGIRGRLLDLEIEIENADAAADFTAGTSADAAADFIAGTSADAAADFAVGSSADAAADFTAGSSADSTERSTVGSIADSASVASAGAERRALYQRFSIRFAKNDRYYTSVSFRPHESVLKIDRKFSGSRRAVINQRRAKVRHDSGKLKLRIILDRFSAEIFVNDGEQVMTATFYTDLAAEGVSFFADGGVRFNIVKYRLAEEGR